MGEAGDDSYILGRGDLSCSMMPSFVEGKEGRVRNSRARRPRLHCPPRRRVDRLRTSFLFHAARAARAMII